MSEETGMTVEGEGSYREWCRNAALDPHDVATAIRYENAYAEWVEESYRARP